MSARGIFGLRCFREWLGLFAEEVLQSVARLELSFSLSEECLASVRETLLEALQSTARYAMDQAAMRSVGISVDPSAPRDPGIEDLSALKVLVDALKTRGKAALDDKAPFLRTELDAKAEDCRRALLEMLRRIDEHRSEIERVLLNGNRFETIRSVLRRGSLLYSSDRIVTEIVTDGGCFLYKPRDLRIDQWFLEFSRPYVGRLFFVPKALCCAEGFGFTEYVESESADTLPQTPENAYALGALYVMIYIARAADLHEGNVLVSKGRICLPDLETILLKDKYTQMPSSLKHLTDIFRDLIRAGEEFFFAGIKDTYRGCMADREKLSLAVERAGTFWVRDMIRGGAQYAMLAKVFRQLEGIRSREERLTDEDHFRQVLRETAGERHKAFSDAELAHVTRGSSMVLTLRAGARDAYCDGRLLRKDYIPQSPVEKTKSVIHGMTERELQQFITEIRRYLDSNEE